MAEHKYANKGRKDESRNAPKSAKKEVCDDCDW